MRAFLRSPSDMVAVRNVSQLLALLTSLNSRLVVALRKLIANMAIAGIAPALLGAAVFVAPSVPASAATPANGLPCHASMSNYHPADYTTVTVRVRTAGLARVTTVAHYRTTSTTHHGRANSAGRAGIRYYISGATPGYKVKVSVTVRKGTRKGSCSTAFTPHR